jgi:EAL domain-containing protein (putative c-di-GMP-specific phosphodiesterase class I)
LTVDPLRFLGLAFASADLLLEIDPDNGLVTFAAGAGRRLAGETDASLIGHPWRHIVAAPDLCVAEALILGLEDGERRGPAQIALAGPDGEQTRASIATFRMPQNGGRVSCSLAMAGQAPASRRGPDGLRERADFERVAKALIEAARTLGPELELGLIGLNGLKGAKAGMGAEDARALQQRIAGALRAESYADAATELGDDRFAVLRRRGEAPEIMERRLSRILGEAVSPSAQTVAVDAASSPSRTMRAMRFALDGFLATGAAPTAASLSEALGQSVRKTVAEASAFGAMVEARDFKLVYQPVISLTDGATHHYEALVRFDGERSPFTTIRMAEDLDIIEDLDLAIAEEAIKRLRNDPTGALRLAINVSGRTMVSPDYFKAVAKLIEGGDVARRLMLEVTESAAIDDLPLAEQHIQAMRAMGVQICLDDFGAGAASFAYLHQLSVDVVKIDGSYVRELTSSGRGDTLIRHLVGLCHELGVTVVAEMVETQAVEDVLRRAGVDFAQGWLYGQPASEPGAQPKTEPKSAPIAPARRRGAVEQWG